jgi:hypothetical protein
MQRTQAEPALVDNLAALRSGSQTGAEWASVYAPLVRALFSNTGRVLRGQTQRVTREVFHHTGFESVLRSAGTDCSTHPPLPASLALNAAALLPVGGVVCLAGVECSARALEALVADHGIESPAAVASFAAARGVLLENYNYAAATVS